MKFGKVRIEKGEFFFYRHMVLNSLPCKDIVWAYIKQEVPSAAVGRHLLTTYLVIVTRRRKIYQFDMAQKDADSCIHLLKALNSEMTVGFPGGDRVHLESVPNTRDMGALLSLDHRHIVPRRLLRSGDLYHLSKGDQKILREEYHLKKVIDLRSKEEYEERPDTVMAGVEYYHLPILDEEVAGPVKIRTLSGILSGEEVCSQEQYEGLYESMFTDEYSVKQFARILDLLRDSSGGAVLWHGGVGKDRTGIVTMLILSVLGISRKVIREDFLRSNEFLESDKKYMQLYLKDRDDYNELRENQLKFFYNVEESYLTRAFYSIDREYGSMQTFLKKGLLLNPKMIQELRNGYLL